MKFVVAALATTIAAGAVNAGGYVAPVAPAPTPVIEAAVPVDASDWTGFYAGLQYGQGDLEASQDGRGASLDVDGFGVHGGYLRDLGRFVVGGELDWNRLNADDDGLDGDADLLRLRGRAGYDMGRFLPYVSLGAARIEADDLSETGFTYGIGAEFKVTERFSVGAEYSRQEFNDFDGVDGLDVDADLVQVRGSFRF